MEYISFPVSTDILACQVSNGQFCHINSPLYTADISSSCSYALFLQNRDRINKFCLLSMANQMQDEAININDNFGSISTLHSDKRFTSCLQFTSLIKLHFPYDIVYLPDVCKANAITFLLSSNNKLNLESINESPNQLGFKGSHSKIDNFSLMQTLNILSLIDYKLEVLASKIPEMKHVSISGIMSALTKLRSFTSTFWPSMKVKLFSAISITL